MTSRQDPDHHIRNLKFDFEATKIVAFEDPESEMKEYYWLAPHLLDQLKHLKTFQMHFFLVRTRIPLLSWTTTATNFYWSASARAVKFFAAF